MGGTGQGGMAGGSSSSVDLDDAEVLHAATTLNGGEVAEAQLALSRSENSAVRTYAEQMVAEHGLAIQQIATLAATQQLTPDDNPISESLRVKSEANLKALAAESAERFDRQYILSQVAMHQSALALVDAQLIPSAERAEIDTLLASLRTTVAEHLTRAQAVLATLP
jgi:putative membrane protein